MRPSARLSAAWPSRNLSRFTTILFLAIVLSGASFAQFQRVPKPADPPKAPAASGPVPPVEGEDFVIRTDVRLVRAEVQVTQNKRVISELTREDFVLRDEGTPTEIVDFSVEGDPLDLMLLLDVSGSMTAFLYDVARAADEALKQLESTDRLGVMIFSKDTKTLSELSAPRADALASLQSLARQPGMGAGTAINASIMSAVKAIQDDAAGGSYDPKRRRAILILTDNWGINYNLPDRVVLRALHQENISMHAIVVGRVRKPESNWAEFSRDGFDDEVGFSLANVFQLAEDTGGDIFSDLKKEGLANILSRIRNRFSVYFKPSPNAQPGSFRKIQVTLRPETARKLKNAVVRARAGYYAN